MRMRKFHRWISTAAMVLLLYVSVTGLLLALDGVTVPDFGPPGGSGPATPMQSADIERWVSDAANKAIRDYEGTISAIVQLRAPNGAPAAAVYFNGATQTPHAAWRVRMHDLLQHLHRGSILGIPGQVMDVLTGLSLAVLSITGIVMYVQMLRRRRGQGRSDLFWG
jgi:hypothetical protein